MPISPTADAALTSSLALHHCTVVQLGEAAMERNLARRRLHREGRATRVAGAIRQSPWSQPRLTYRPVEILSDDQIEAIHRASLTVLETVGMKVLDAEARRIFKCAGAAVDDSAMVVRLDRGLVEEKVKLA